MRYALPVNAVVGDEVDDCGDHENLVRGPSADHSIALDISASSPGRFPVPGDTQSEAKDDEDDTGPERKHNQKPWADRVGIHVSLPLRVQNAGDKRPAANKQQGSANPEYGRSENRTHAALS